MKNFFVAIACQHYSASFERRVTYLAFAFALPWPPTKIDQCAHPRFRGSEMEHQFRKERKTSGLTSGVDASFRFDVESLVGRAAFSQSVDRDDVVDDDNDDEPESQDLN